MSGDRVTYTHGHHAAVLRSHATRTAVNSAAYLLPHLAAGQSLLDVGCGPGTITADLAALVAPGPVTAVDAAADVLTAAQRVAAERGLSNVTVAVADVHALDFPDDSFDVVHAHQVLQHVADPVQALRELRRVVKPGGLVAVRDADYAAMTWYPRSAELADWQELYRQTARRNGGEPDAGRFLLAWAHAAGFTDITPTAATWCYATPETRGWWSETWADRVRDSPLGRAAVDYGFARPADLDRVADGWLAWGRDPDAWFAVLHGELLCRK